MGDTAATQNDGALPTAKVAAGRPITISHRSPPLATKPDQPSGGRAPIANLPRRKILDRLLWATPSWLLSMVLHIVGLLLLAMLYLPAGVADDLLHLVASTEGEEDLGELAELADQPLDEVDFTEIETLTLVPEPEPETPQVYAFDEPPSAVSVTLDELGIEHAPRDNLLAVTGTYTGDSFSGRGEHRASLAAVGGATPESEEAVAMALEWLAEHQMPDGGWNFDHTQNKKCGRKCRSPGSISVARNAATGLALLPFLGAGQTHITGQYKKQVKDGLYYLKRSMKISPRGGSFNEPAGQMYAHGIASIALCEAYAMTRDKSLRQPAQEAIDYICYAQDTVGGGWRYQPRTPGDTSVVGWQIMALKSGHMAYLRVPPLTIKRAYSFLDSVEADSGSQYGYTNPGTGRAATTAIGLLCRMYLGWKQDEPALVRGFEWLGSRGPSSNDMYYNYYATQVMRHMEGPLWERWNKIMRDELVDSQATTGHERGSWFMSSRHGGAGGRLYCTAMAAMILEVYYRHLPIYGRQSTRDDFPLD
jgi:hypothetical protein